MPFRGQNYTGDVRRGDSFSQPEILPPVGAEEPARPYDWTWRTGQPPQQRPQATPVRQRSYPVTWALVGLNVGVFLTMVFTGVSAVSPNTDELIRWGAMSGVLILGSAEWWRLVTATFVHGGIIHLATNMYCLWNLGLLAEPLLGPGGLLAIYLLTGVAGNVLGLAVHPRIPGVGASGAVFGIAGVLIVLLKSARLPVPEPELKSLRRSVIYFAVINLLIGGFTWAAQTTIQIDNMAHLGGFLSGLALGVPLAPRVMTGRRRYLRAQGIIFSVAAVLLAAVAFGIYRLYMS